MGVASGAAGEPPDWLKPGRPGARGSVSGAAMMMRPQLRGRWLSMQQLAPAGWPAGLLAQKLLDMHAKLQKRERSEAPPSAVDSHFWERKGGGALESFLQAAALLIKNRNTKENCEHELAMQHAHKAGHEAKLLVRVGQ